MFHFLTRFPLSPASFRPRLGLDVGPRHLRLAILRRRRSQLQLYGLAEHRFGQVICRHGRITDLDLLCNAARAMLTQCRFSDGVLGMALGLHAAAAVPLTLPAAASDLQRLAQVQAEMALRHPQSPDELVAHYCPLDEAMTAGEDVRVIALFASMVDIEDRCALASSLQLRPGVIALRETRIATFLRQAHQAPRAGILHVDLDEAWLDLPGRWVHHFEWSAQNDRPATLLHALAPLLQPPPELLLLSGDAPMLATLAQVIGKYSDRPTQIATLSPRFCDMRHHGDPTPAFHAALALAAGALA
ncbi:hypothetical protein [Herbaspirillum sp. alder98]|uniref:hypothetical protein n=1 Tax=Herbaspirillum sp. alder98 TaxID=2913096 RepID=UPI001CD8A40D|nr:hypothetical protein [Herbaspirillum sp. alder98]MCA1324194.1 hypothetical protein [Herbaspirillum sp. alder98]